MSDELICIVEIPKGSRNKYEYDEERGGIRLDRYLMPSVVYPTDYGFIPETLALDGDPLDVLVCLSEPTFPGCIVPVKAIGVFEMEDEHGIDDTILCVPLNDPGWNHLAEIDDLPEQLRMEISHFFDVYKDLDPERHSKINGWGDRHKALATIEDSRRRHREQVAADGKSLSWPPIAASSARCSPAGRSARSPGPRSPRRCRRARCVAVGDLRRQRRGRAAARLLRHPSHRAAAAVGLPAAVPRHRPLRRADDVLDDAARAAADARPRPRRRGARLRRSEHRRRRRRGAAGLELRPPRRGDPVSPPVLVGVALLGGAGAVLRLLLDGAVSARTGGAFPAGTLAVNLSGALAARRARSAPRPMATRSGCSARA